MTTPGLYLDHMGNTVNPNDPYERIQEVDEVFEERYVPVHTVMITAEKGLFFNPDEPNFKRIMVHFKDNAHEFYRLVNRMACTMAEVDDYSDVRSRTRVHQAITNMLGYVIMFQFEMDHGLRHYVIQVAEHIRRYLRTGYWKQLDLVHQSPTHLFFVGTMYETNPY